MGNNSSGKPCACVKAYPGEQYCHGAFLLARSVSIGISIDNSIAVSGGINRNFIGRGEQYRLAFNNDLGISVNDIGYQKVSITLNAAGGLTQIIKDKGVGYTAVIKSRRTYRVTVLRIEDIGSRATFRVTAVSR